MKNPFLKYMMKEKKENIFHSSAYGKAQNAEAIGTTSVESFEARMRMEKNRQIVHGYNDSRIANSMYSNGPRAKKYVPVEKKDGMLDKSSISDKSTAGRFETAATTKSVTTTESTTTAKSANMARPVATAKPVASPVKRVFAPVIKPNFGK